MGFDPGMGEVEPEFASEFIEVCAGPSLSLCDARPLFREVLFFLGGLWYRLSDVMPIEVPEERHIYCCPP